MIAIIDYHMGNLGSIMNMFNRVGSEAVLTNDKAVIERADRLVLPGVGAFDKGMENLEQLQLIHLLTEKVLGEGVPILGLCLGMQLFLEGSEEGRRDGLGWVRGTCRRFDLAGIDPALKVPHMGWNTIELCRPHPVFENLAEDHRYYFVHGYYTSCADSDDVLATTCYGIEFPSALNKGAITGVQFHPEKSLRWGMDILKRYGDA